MKKQIYQLVLIVTIPALLVCCSLKNRDNVAYEVAKSLNDCSKASEIVDAIRDSLHCPSGPCFCNDDFWKSFEKAPKLEINLNLLEEHLNNRGYKLLSLSPFLTIKTKWHTYRVEFRWIGKKSKITTEKEKITIEFELTTYLPLDRPYTIKLYDEKDRVYEGFLYYSKDPCGTFAIEEVYSNFEKDQKKLKSIN